MNKLKEPTPSGKPKEPAVLDQPKQPAVPSKPQEPAVLDQPKQPAVPSKPKGSVALAKPEELTVPDKTAEPTDSQSEKLVAVQGKEPALKSATKPKRLEISVPSKPQKPVAQSEAERVAEEDDEDEDLQAALQESLKAPSSPQPQSGAQSSTPTVNVDLFGAVTIGS